MASDWIGSTVAEKKVEYPGNWVKFGSLSKHIPIQHQRFDDYMDSKHPLDDKKILICSINWSVEMELACC